jgi:hypothetical protein
MLNKQEHKAANYLKKTAAFQVAFVINQMVTAKFPHAGILQMEADVRDGIKRIVNNL